MTSIVGTLLEIQPGTEVIFNYMPNKYLTGQIILKNITDNKVAYKIKTNAPQSYLVKPHTGLLTSGQNAIVEVTMQPLQIDPQSSQIKDKFLITACPVPLDTDMSNLDRKWDEKTVISHKLKVSLRYDMSQSKETSKPAVIENKDPITTKDSNLNLKEESSFNNNVDTTPQGRTSSFQNPSLKDSIQGKSSEGNDKNASNRKVDIDAVLSSVESEKNRHLEDIQTLLKKTQDQDRLINELETEKASIKSELDQYRTKAFNRHMTKDTAPQINNYQLWHVIMVAIFGLIFGAFLSSN